jgi:hypothetical protein
MSAIIHPFSRQVSPNLRAGLPDPSKYTVCRKHLSSGWLVDLRFELGLTHTSVKEPVAIRSGWGLPPRPERGRPGASWCPSKAAMAPSYPDYDVQCGSPRVSGAKRASNAVSFLALGGADRELIIDIGEDRDVGVDPSRQAAAKLQHGDLA